MLTRAPCAEHDPFASNSQARQIFSGDTVFLLTFAGRCVDVSQEAVGARWALTTQLIALQSLVIEKEGGGPVFSGDTVFLLTNSRKYLDVAGDEVRARWSDRGSIQSWTIISANSSSGAAGIVDGENVLFQASTGKYMTAEEDSISASGFLPKMWQRFSIQSQSTPVQMTTSMTTATANQNISEANAVQPGDVVFLKDQLGLLVDVEAELVQARWPLRGTWQALVLEKAGDGPISSGDSVFLRTWSGSYIRADGLKVTAQPGPRSFNSAWAIVSDGGGVVRNGDTVYLKALSTGLSLEVGSKGLQANSTAVGPAQAFQLERENPLAIFSGQKVSLRSAETGRRLGLEGTDVSARWREMTAASAIFMANDENLGPWMHSFTVQGGAGRVIYHGDAIFLRAYNGNVVDAGADGRQLRARWPQEGLWQTFVIEKLDVLQSGGAVLPGDSVVLKTYNGLRGEVFIVEAFGDDTDSSKGQQQYRQVVVRTMIIIAFCFVVVFEFMAGGPQQKA